MGKGRLFQVIALGRVVPPVLILFLPFTDTLSPHVLLVAFSVVFFVLGALANGLTIAAIGFLMEISPEDRRPSYGGYFNALTAPAFLLPFVGGVLVSVTGLAVLFSLSLVAAVLQFLLVRRLRKFSRVDVT